MSRLESRLLLLAIVVVLMIVVTFLKRNAAEKNRTRQVLGLAALLSMIMTYFVFTASIVDNQNPDLVETSESKELRDLSMAARNDVFSVEAWNKLGREYLLKQNYDKAYQAFNESRQVDYSALFDSQQSLQSTPISETKRIERLKWLTGLAEARILAQGGLIDEESEKFLKLALALDPQHPKALWYGGLNAAQKQDYAHAKQFWESLAAQKPPGTLGEVLRQRLQSLEEFLKSEAVTSTTPEWELKLKIIIPDELKAMSDPLSRVYVSLRQNSDMPPLAAKQFALSDLDDVVSLTDFDSIPAMRAQQAANWDESLRLDILWSPAGKVAEKGNIRFASMLNRANLSGVNEFVLDPKLGVTQ